MPNDANGIDVLESAEAVRKRPEMYVGPLPDPAVVNRLVQEVLCLSVDEALCGRCTEITVAVDSAGVITIRDNGPGLPMEPNRHGLTQAELLLTAMYACRAAKESEAAREHCCELGLVIVNFLSQCSGSGSSATADAGPRIIAMEKPRRRSDGRRKRTRWAWSFPSSLIPASSEKPSSMH